MIVIRKSEIDQRNQKLIEHHKSLGSPRCELIQMTTFTTDDQNKLQWRSVLRDGKVEHTFTLTQVNLVDMPIMIVDDTKDHLLENAQRAPKVGKNATNLQSRNKSPKRSKQSA